MQSLMQYKQISCHSNELNTKYVHWLMCNLQKLGATQVHLENEC